VAFALAFATLAREIDKQNKKSNRFYDKFCLHEDFMYTAVMNKKRICEICKNKKTKLFRMFFI